MTNRRQFLQGSRGAAGLVGLNAAGRAAANAAGQGVEPAAESLRILVLGGTGFIGPHEIEYAIARGHKVTMFNRGRRAGLYGDQVEELIGNRDNKVDDGLKALAGDRTWDVCIDNSGYITRHVRDSVELLGDRVGRYLYVSTVAAYDFTGAHDFNEEGTLDHMEDPSMEEVTWETYGPLKAECDRLVRFAYGARATVVRPTYIIGPGDTTDRFTYWADRIPRGGDVIGPANANVAVQFVDVRDLCPWIIELAENDTPGIFNAAGAVWTRGGLLWGIRAVSSEAVTFHWPTAELANELELSAPMLDWGDQSNTFTNEASLAAGMVYRTLAESAIDTREWWLEQTAERREGARGWPTDEQVKEALARMPG